MLSLPPFHCQSAPDQPAAVGGLLLICKWANSLSVFQGPKLGQIKIRMALLQTSLIDTLASFCLLN